MLGHILTDQELDFVLGLLQHESKKLSMEISRTDGHTMRQELHDRQRTADRLIERFRELKAGLLKP